MPEQNEQIAPVQPVSGRLPSIGTPGSPTVDIITVQGIASGMPIPVTGSGTFSVTGAVTTAAPTYTAGTSQAFSLTTGGALRIDGSGVTQPVSVSSIPLPAGAATDATLTGGTARTRLTDGTNTVGVSNGSVASSETLDDRLKVNSALRLLDRAQPTGAQLVAATGDQLSGMWVNTRALPRTTVAEGSLAEQMAALVASNYAAVTLLAQAVALMRGRTDPSIGDEGDALIGEYLDNRNRVFN